jgi:hypothetical protein
VNAKRHWAFSAGRRVAARFGLYFNFYAKANLLLKKLKSKQIEAVIMDIRFFP